MQVRLLCQNIDFHSYLMELIEIPEDTGLVHQKFGFRKVGVLLC